MKSDWLIISELVTALSVKVELKHVMDYGSPSLLCESGAESPELSRIFHIQLLAWSHDADLLDQEELKKNPSLLSALSKQSSSQLTWHASHVETTD